MIENNEATESAVLDSLSILAPRLFTKRRNSIAAIIRLSQTLRVRERGEKVC